MMLSLPHQRSIASLAAALALIALSTNAGPPAHAWRGPSVDNSTIAGANTYEPYGERVVDTGTANLTEILPGTYQGKKREPFGLYNFPARPYDSRLGGFTQQDPIASGANTYAYPENDPINVADPTGMTGEPRQGCADGGNAGCTVPGPVEFTPEELEWTQTTLDASRGGKVINLATAPSDRIREIVDSYTSGRQMDLNLVYGSDIPQIDRKRLELYTALGASIYVDVLLGGLIPSAATTTRAGATTVERTQAVSRVPVPAATAGETLPVDAGGLGKFVSEVGEAVTACQTGNCVQSAAKLQTKLPELLGIPQEQVRRVGIKNVLSFSGGEESAFRDSATRYIGNSLLGDVMDASYTGYSGLASIPKSVVHEAVAVLDAKGNVLLVADPHYHQAFESLGEFVNFIDGIWFIRFY